MPRLPTLFLSHGSPMNGIESTPSSLAWAALARELPKPRAVLMASAHWETSVPMLTGNPKPETIHDFGGFPDALFQVRYPAPGAPDLAAQAVALLKDAGITAGVNGCRGLDHGAWVPLRWMYPDNDVPVVEISLQPSLGTARHVELGRALASLADDGVLIVGSGHATHNDLFAMAAVLASTLVFAPMARSAGGAMVFFGAAACGGGGIYVLVTADMLRRVPVGRTSAAGGMTAGAQSLAHIVASPLVGMAIDRTHGYGVVLVALGLFVVPTSFAFVLWPKMQQG